jgi:DNA-binding CsgD family transcriptional regulator
VLAAAEREVGEDEAVRLRGEGRRLGLHEAVGYALVSATTAVPTAGAPTPGAPITGAPATTAPTSPGLATQGPHAKDAATEPDRARMLEGPGPARKQTARAMHDNGAAPSVLTAREQEIALLIARGLSNRGIAAELVISPATAARHVANILAKLGLSSRAQVAAWTMDQRPGFGRQH